MADSVWTPSLATIAKAAAPPRHAAVVRVTHWLTVLAFFALLVSGIEILISHPRFYWGEAGNVNVAPLFSIPIPASRATVPTGYGYVLPDQNGWSRYLHFQSAWALVLTGLVYLLWGFFTRHFGKHMLPAASDLSPGALSKTVSNHVRFELAADADSYNVLQRLAYLGVIFGLIPLMIWTGLAMSPAIAAVWPLLQSSLGGQQSARTIHFFATLALVLFLVIHVAMVCLAGFRNRMRAITIGSPSQEPS